MTTDTMTNPPEQPSLTERTARHPRRTLNRLAAALAGLLLGAVGQYFFAQEALTEGLVFYGLAVIIFVTALAPAFYPTFRWRSHPLDLGLADGWRRTVGLGLLIITLSVAYYSYQLFGQVNLADQAWQVYLGTLLLLLAAVLLLTRSDSLWAELTRLIPNYRTMIALLVILLIAMFLRLYNFSEQPFGVWYDEAAAGLQARRMVNDPTYRPTFYMPINISGHLLSLYALALHGFGDSIYAMRLVSVTFGLSGVIAAYLFGRELHSVRFGLILAFLLAVLRWHVNFSRIAMTGIDTPCFELFSLFFLVRLLRWGRLRDALFAGLTLGFGLTLYTAFRLYLAGLVLFALVAMLIWLMGFIRQLSQGGWRVYLVNLSMIILTLFLVILPILRFAQDNPEQFWYRVRQASILTKRDQADLTQALWTTTEKHLLMFNVNGDKNGRHNLPGTPMLDPLMGVLLLLGLGLMVARPIRQTNPLFLLLIPATLAGGIFSVDFEAPQSLRSIGVIPVVIYGCGLTILALWNEAEKSLKPLPAQWVTLPGLLLAAFLLYWNGTTYLIDQADNFASWNAFSTPETITAKKIMELGPDYIYYSSPFLTNHPAIRFLAPDAHNQRRFTLPDAVPVRDPPGSSVALFIHPDDRWIYDRAQQLYPNGEFETITNQTEPDRPVIYYVGLQPADLAAIQGLELRYTGLPTERAEPSPNQLFAQTSRTLTVQASWPSQIPPAFAETDIPYQAEWRGIVYVPLHGPHSFRLTTPATGTLEIDGNLILEGQGEQLTGLPLAQGNHAIRVQATGAPGEVSLLWQPPFGNEEPIPSWNLYVPPVSNHGLLGNYYANPDWQGTPIMQRIDPFIDTYFHITPMQRPYSVEWLGSLVAPQSGLYRLGLKAVPQAELFINGASILMTSTPNELTDVGLTLEAGRHDLRLRFSDSVDRSRLHLYWMPPSGPFEAIPSENLWPPLGEYPIPTAEHLTAGTPLDSTLQHEALELAWLTSLGGSGGELGQLIEPRDVALLSNGNIVVADTGNRRVQIFEADLSGAVLASLTGESEPFAEPLAVAVNSRDEILVLDSTLQWIYRYTAEGALLNRFGGPDARLFHPRGLTVLTDDTVVVADTGGARFVFFTADGTLAGSVGGLGSGPGQFNEPTDVIRDPFGIYYVAEAENNRLQRVDAAGNPLGQWAIPETYAYNGPHLTFALDGSIFMTESQSGSIFRYTPDGNQLNQWQTITPIQLGKPVGIYLDERTNTLYVTDVQTGHLHLFQIQ